MKQRILIIEDEETILELLRTGLSYEGYIVFTAQGGIKGLELLRQEEIDLVILDIMLPDIDGFEVLRRIRKRGIDTPVLMLTAKKEISDRVTGLDLGADDYLTKPFSFDELLARIRALLRRASRTKESLVIRIGDISLDPETREAKRAGVPIKLTRTEFDLLELFMRHPKRVFTRQTLLNRIWGYDYVGDTNIVDVHVSHLRQKIGDRPPRLIRTFYGLGYGLYPEDDDGS